MTETDEQTEIWTLPDNVQIYYNGDEELRLRSGTWNFEEAILTLDDLSAELKDCVTQIFGAFQSGDSVDSGQLPNRRNITNLEEQQIVQMLQTLRAKHYLSDPVEDRSGAFLNQLLAGAADFSPSTTSSDEPVLFFADTQSVKDYAVMLADEIGMNLTVMGDEEYQAVARADLGTRTDAYQTRSDELALRRMLEPYACVTGCLERPHVMFLRNLNRVLIETSQPLSLGVLDGPFTTAFTIKPTETGCFECLEQRLLARMREMPSYQRFVEQTRSVDRLKHKVGANPLLHPLAAEALFEANMICHVGKARLAGRVLNTYVPLMEVQVQPILRVPFCPACGFVAEAEMEEMYSSSRKLMDRIADRVRLVSDGGEAQ